MTYHPETQWVRDMVRRWRDADTPFAERYCEHCEKQTETHFAYGHWLLCEECAIQMKQEEDV